MAKKQYFGIKYPFTNNSFENYEFDLNNNEVEKVASEILHLIFTPKGQRLRMPDYGTDLIKFIFNSTGDDNWTEIKQEIQKTVNQWVENTTLNNIEVLSDNNGREIYVRVDYTVNDGIDDYSNSIVVNI